MARRCVDQLRYWRIMEHRTCAAQAYSTLEVLWTAAVPTMHVKTQFYVALSLSYRAMYGCARRNQTSDPRLRMQRELLYVPLKFWLGGSLTMVGDGRVELPSSVYQTLIIAVIRIANRSQDSVFAGLPLLFRAWRIWTSWLFIFSELCYPF